MAARWVHYPEVDSSILSPATKKLKDEIAMSRTNNALKECKEKGYYVDTDGNVYGSKGCKRLLRVSTTGYYTFSYKPKDKRSNISIPVHRLQAFQKFGDRLFDDGIEVRHLNNNPLDNSFDNIGIGTHIENMQDKPKHLIRFWASHPKHPHEEIIKDRKNGLKYKQLMEKYGIRSKGTISFIIKQSLKTNEIISPI